MAKTVSPVLPILRARLGALSAECYRVGDNSEFIERETADTST